MKENLQYKPKDSEIPPISVPTESANDSVYGKEFNETNYIITEVIIADNEFARKELQDQERPEQNNQSTPVDNIANSPTKPNPQYPDYLKIEKNLRNDAIPTAHVINEPQPEKTKLTRADFPGTGSAQMPELVYKKNFFPAPKSMFQKLVSTLFVEDTFTSKATKEKHQPNQPVAQKAEAYPRPQTKGFEHKNVQENFRTNEIPTADVINEPKPEKPRLTRADFPGTGSAQMPELVYKKNFFPAPKKSLLRRMIPNFISKWFG